MTKQSPNLLLHRFARWLVIHRADLLALAFLVALGIQYLNGIMQVYDLELFDETDFLYTGIHLLQTGLRDPSWGPLYALWYFLISPLAPDRISLFYLNIYFIILLPVLALYIFLRTNQVSLWWSWASAVLLMTIATNLLAEHRAEHMALLCLLVGLIFASRARSTLGALVDVTLGALAAMYCRPEHTITFFVLVLVLIALFLRQWSKEHRAQRVAVVGTFAVMGLALWGIGNPLSSPLSAWHSYEAFSQHFTVNWLTHYPNGMDPWTSGASIMPQFFPTAQTIPQAMMENPGAFAQHLRWNLTLLVKGFATGPFTTFFYTPVFGRQYEILLFAAFALLFIFRNKTLLTNLKQRPVVVLTLVCAWTVVVLSSLVTMPRPTFLFLPIAFSLALIVVLVAGGAAGRSPALWQIGVVGLLTLAFIPSVGSIRAGKPPRLAATRYLSQLNIRKPVTLLSPLGKIGDYFSDDYNYVLIEAIRGQEFKTFLQDQNINMVITTPHFEQDPRYQSSPAWNQFLTHPADFGFVERDIPGTQYKLYLANSLLSR